MPFLSQLCVQRYKGSWIVLEPLIFESNAAQACSTVPIGFITDFASVPRLPFAFLFAGDTAHEAAVIHDYLYQFALTDKKTADAVFLEAMEETEVPWWRRRLMHAAVESFGRGGFKAESAEPDIYAG